MASSSSSSTQPSKSQQPSKSTRTDGLDILNNMLVLVASPSVACRRSRPADDSRSCPTARAVRSLRRKLSRHSSSSESVTSSANRSTSSLFSSSSSTFSGDTLADSSGNLTLDKAVPAAESSSCTHQSTSLSPISHDNTHTKCRKCLDADSVPALCNQLKQLCVCSRAKALCTDTVSSLHPLNEKLAVISLSNAAKPEFTVATSSVCNDDDSDDDSDRENGGALAESSREVEVSSSHDTKVAVYAVAAVEEPTMSEVKDQRRQRQEELDASIAELSKFLDEPSTLIAAASSSLSAKTDEIATESQLAAFNDLYSTYTTTTLSKGSSSSRPAEDEPPYIFTTAYAQQILLLNGYTGVLDSADALEAFNRLMATGSLETEPVFASSAVPRSASTISSILAGKPGVAHAPALSAPVPVNASGPGSSPHSSSPSSSSPFGRLLAPPSPPLEETLIEDELESMSSIFDLGAAADSPSTLRDAEDPLVERFRAIRGMNRVFPGLGSRNSSEPSFGSDVRGSNQVAANSGNPMSISRLMSQEPTPTSSSTSQGYQSSSSSSGPDYYSGIGGIGSFLAAAAAGSNTGSDLGHGYNRPVCGELSNYTYSRRRASSVAGSRTSQDDEEEDGNVSTTSSNYAATTASTASSTVSVLQLPALSPPPLVNFSTHPVHRQRASVTPPMQQRSLALSSGMTSPSYSLSVTTQVSNTSPKPSHSPSPSSSGSSAGGPQRSRPRKQQCPECSGWFSNLAAHSAVHMAYSSRPYSCLSCGRGFSRPNDLLRHQKAHQGDSPFACPYYHIDSRCHSSGGFSRCDTYKNHLRAMHFEYPAGVKKKDRNGAAGKCKGCNRDFRNADEWVATHVETGECPELNSKPGSAGSSNNDEKKN